MRPLIARRGPVLPPRDPAPSIWSYRFQRLWLTPIFRSFLRVGLPAFAVIMAVGWYMSEPANWRAVTDQVSEVRREIENRPEFRVNLMNIDGASPQLAEELRGVLALDLPVSSFDLDLDAMRTTLEEVPAVDRAELRIQSGGYLAVTIEERQPVIIWQTRVEPVLLDAEGNYVASVAERELIAPLPMIAGEGADLAVEEALALIEAAAPLGERLHGLVRMGERRWDVVLRDGRRILLPAEDAQTALDRVLALDDAQDVLGRDVVRIDMRNPARPSLQLSPHALTELRRMRGIEIGDGNG
ncbi:FtsQ-type POTRA domain-containing protein [Roseobacter sp. HKCCD9010]|uniref:cell division protein FtsQ/DivIB n=1 Tax=unclassified Roseobacter TaxID=196798 RepID=UPI001492A0EE|nr:MULTISPECIES: cell division protein FtsQ/DivIB [unclassified Roseobacter]MBF9049531.1 FtsQ-type POTRA domain-containing protein [Rhodobacterales bacterium HKCCD4356]NNV11531.1 FtsQ-type POTRA domain-containing protein [Roseobacter sp. HKCCD7357]NNV15715.1 FtsQ-type POTRA domain-containing protein [Roseobacter sp. HKCCD8768]NNV25175.1 FtsQ-type POTRA domain-containing protein [Roseobacter sp. HKCCD8192]NNV29432.1 FtsQ-type POTRA domain-containing protein [Roseobacter sp. HKCCD9061]